MNSMKPFDQHSHSEYPLPKTPFSKGPGFRVSLDYINPFTAFIAVLIGCCWLIEALLY